MSIFLESWAPNPDFGKNPVFGVREQLHRFRTKPTPDSDWTWSKVPPAIWNLFFDRMCATPFAKKSSMSRGSNTLKVGNKQSDAAEPEEVKRDERVREVTLIKATAFVFSTRHSVKSFKSFFTFFRMLTIDFTIVCEAIVGKREREGRIHRLFVRLYRYV